jgi:hypothetical protein
MFKMTPAVRYAQFRGSQNNYVEAVFVSGGSELEIGSSELIPYSLLEQ